MPRVTIRAAARARPRDPGPVTAPDRPGWLVGPAGVPYPPEPWYLGGSLLLSVLRVPIAELPDRRQGLRAAGPRPALAGPGRCR